LAAGEASAGFKLRFGSSGGNNTSTSSQSSGSPQGAATTAPDESSAARAPTEPRAAPAEESIRQERPTARIDAPSMAAEKRDAATAEQAADAAPVAGPVVQSDRDVTVNADRSPDAGSSAAPASTTPAASTPTVTVSQPAGSTPQQHQAQPANPSRIEAPETVTQTSYAKRSRRPAGGTGEISQPTAAPALHSRQADVSVVTCGAGCASSPGEVVYRKLITPSQPGLVNAATRDPGAPSAVVCVAGCYDGPRSYQAVPMPSDHMPGAWPAARAPRGIQASAGSGRMVPTAAGTDFAPGQAPSAATSTPPLPRSKGSSGEWMMRINRERAGGS
jgi:hypothetical protein